MDKILNLIGSVSEGFPSYFINHHNLKINSDGRSSENKDHIRETEIADSDNFSLVLHSKSHAFPNY